MYATTDFHPLAHAGHAGPFAEVFEHEQTWLICNACGAQWAIVDTSNGQDTECVSDGDGYCEACPER